MTVIGVNDAAGRLQLHSCPSCGRHSWRSDGREVDRNEVLDALRVTRTPARRPAGAGARTAAETAPHEGDRRDELQRLLVGFTVHGTTS